MPMLLLGSYCLMEKKNIFQSFSIVLVDIQLRCFLLSLPLIFRLSISLSVSLSLSLRVCLSLIRSLIFALSLITPSLSHTSSIPQSSATLSDKEEEYHFCKCKSSYRSIVHQLRPCDHFIVVKSNQFFLSYYLLP